MLVETGTGIYPKKKKKGEQDETYTYAIPRIPRQKIERIRISLYHYDFTR